MSPLSRSLMVAAGLAMKAGQVAAVNFSLFAYGTGFQGYPVVYKDDLAYIFAGNITTSTEYTPVTFTLGSTTGLTTFTGNPDNGTSVANPAVANATWSDAMLYIPSDGEQVGFTSSASDNQQTDVYRLFGATAVANVDGSYRTPYTAVESEDGVWQLKWNDTSGTSITLRRDQPDSDTSGKKLKVKRAYEIVT